MKSPTVLIAEDQTEMKRLLDRFVDLMEMEADAIREEKWNLARAVRKERAIVQKKFVECDKPGVRVVRLD